MAVTPSSMHAGERRLVYGFNVGVMVVVATAILALAVVLGGEARRQFDWTRSGVNSLSLASQKLVRGLDKPVRLTALYPIRTEAEELDENRRRAVADLLALYEAQNAERLTVDMVDPMKDQGAIRALLQRLQNKPAYADEAAAHQALLERFDALRQQLAAVATEDYQQLLELAGQVPQLNRNSEFGIIALRLRDIGETAERLAQTLTDLTQGAAPRYGRAVERVRDFLSAARSDLETAQGWMTGAVGDRPTNVPEAAQAFFDAAPQRYGVLLEQASDMLDEAQGLDDAELEEAYSRLQNVLDSPPIVVETDAEVYVIPFRDVWAFPTDQQAPPSGGPDPQREFLGEQAVSSAILRLTQDEQTGVVFVRFGGTPLLEPDFSNFNPMMGQMPSAPLQQLNEVLEDAYFATAEWDLQSSDAPPTLDDVKRTVYVVLPPAPPEQPNPMRPPTTPGISPAQQRKLFDAVADSGMAVFLAGWQPPTNPMATSGADYAYRDYLRDEWGLDVQANLAAMAFVASPEQADLWVPVNYLNDQADPLLLASPDSLRLTDHPIAKPLQGLTAGLPLACPLKPLADPNGPDVDWQPLATVPRTERVWAVSDFQRLQSELREQMGTRPGPGDLRAPFMTAAAGTRGDDKLVVFGSDRFAHDRYAQARGLTRSGNAFVMFALYPANTDLLVNALHWLTDDADRIAVGPRRGGVPRLDKLTEGAAETFCRVMVVGVWPAVALAAGGVMWLLRRR